MKHALASALLLVLVLDEATASAEALSSGTPEAAGTQDVRTSTALIVLVADEPGDAVSDQLERDLRSLGLAVIVLSATPENSNGTEALERTARSLGGIAAIRVLASARGSELWLSDAATAHTLTRSLTPAATSSGDPREVALGTLELLRASMMELHAQSRAAAASPCPEPGAPRGPPSPPTKTAIFSLSGGLAAELGLRSVGPSLSTLWAVGLKLGGCFGLRAFAALPLFAEQADVPEGHVEVEPLLLGGGLGCSFVRDGARLWPRVSLGLAGARVMTRGTAIDPVRSSNSEVWLAGGYGMLGLGLRVTRDVRVNLDATGVLLPTPAVILVDRQQVATWGAPGGMLSLGVEVLAGP
ncbi:MAG TPA: hypothetical protein VIW29_16500 [Polyangiaceae bacterium]